MSIEQTDVVDVIHFEKESDEVVLTISDHLEWGDSEHDHLFLLQEKLNTYLRFIESREILEQYPKAQGKKIVISVVGKFPLSQSAKQFYTQATSMLEEGEIKLRFKQFEE